MINDAQGLTREGFSDSTKNLQDRETIKHDATLNNVCLGST